MENFSILVVDDAVEARQRLVRMLARDHLAEEARDGAEALVKLERKYFDLVLLDQRMPGLSGLEVLRRIKEKYPSVEVIMVTAVHDRSMVVACIKSGAEDFIVKPIRLPDLKQMIEKLKERRLLIAENQRLRSEVNQRANVGEIVGESAATTKVLEAVRKVAPMPIPVLIYGESGSGKELIARAIHHNSPRHRQSFLAVNCGSFVDSLLASELFGHVGGAFTDGRDTKPGLFHAAQGGTLFLDEIGDISANFQAQLLRVLETSEILPVGSTTPRTVDTRVIAATNRDLKASVAEQTFRQDLYFRLWRFPIRAPTLRERATDVPLLARHFLRLCSEKLNKRALRFSVAAMRALVRYRWPGNVRELKAIVERAVILAEGEEVGLQHLFIPSDGPPDTESQHELFEGSWKEAKKRFEREYIVHTLSNTDANVSQAARVAGMDRKNFRNKMKAHAITRGELEPSGDPLKGE